MLFNSLKYLVFFFIVFFAFWTINKKVKFRNIFIITISYIFYGFWDIKFLGLIIFSSCLDFFIGAKLNNTQNKDQKKILLFISMTANIGLLMYFKYCNFFIDSFQDLMLSLGFNPGNHRLDIILPVGISFYTFQTMSYTIDVYREKIKTSKDFISFLAFVAFFPQLVAGPIERAKNLLPQFYKASIFNYQSAVIGLRQILWGFFKKVVIADNCATLVNEIFANYESLNSLVLIMGAILFAFQIYGDFSGYSDIAIGTSRLLGFNLMQNFAFPYFSRDIAEFWRRWHISLSTWFRDYIYIPLGGSKGSKIFSIRNVLIIFLISGFWHGANWTFILWGGLNALFLIPLILLNRNRNNIDFEKIKINKNSIKNIFKILFTFLLVCSTWIFFRSDSLTEAFNYYFSIINNFGVTLNAREEYLYNDSTIWLCYYLILFLAIEWLNRFNSFGLEKLPKLKFFKFSTYLILCILIIHHFGEESQFIYFQF